jgi:hypothetical protein
MFRPQVLITLSFSFLAGSLLVADQLPAPQQSPKAGAVVFIDPATGKIRQPDASEIGGLVPPAPATVAPKAPEPAMIQGPGGAIGIKLGEDSLSYAVATITPDDKVSLDCVAGGQAAAQRIAVKPPAPPAKTKTKAKAPGNVRDPR